MKTRTKMNSSVKLLSAMLLSVTLATPMVVEAGRGHHHHHHRHHHHDHHRHHHHDHHRHHQHHQHHHHNTQNIYYNQPYYPPVYGGGYYRPAPGNFFLGVNTGNVGLMLSGY
ncbi:hypothetical protein [Nitrosomonas sp. Is37]|uniref:hypothetical protein n=1 Tax=Nitrosomonas sp. Is37 TaxID=3080535 RepID=UPI00294B8D6D|nr:hypothetical protein [Nitrosomonas sp. Is37]MDV6344602.1 hypothetical protein [Nitrosomonas sp. Is37]